MDKFLDQITKVAANICDVPISLINLISKDTLLAKSSYGIDIIEVPREITFCNHTIKSNDLFQVKDATKDDRFRDNPFVLNDPKLRFYAGVALVTPRGHRIGTFCLIDIKSNQLKDHQREALHSLARSVIAHFEQNLLNKKILDQSHQFQLVQNISKTGYWELDLQTEETFWSDEVFNIYGISEKSQKNKDTGIKHYSEGDQKKLEQIIGRCVSEKIELKEIFKFYDVNNEFKFIQNTFSPVIEKDGTVLRLKGTIQDVTEIVSNREYSDYVYEKSGIASWNIEVSEMDGEIISSTAGKNVYYLLGYKQGEVTIDHIFMEQNLHEDDKERVLQSYESLLNGESQSLIIQYRLRRKDGTYIHLLNQGRPTTYARNGRAIKFQGILKDISSLIYSLEESDHLKRNLNNLENNISNAFIIAKTDTKGDILEVNEKFEQISGYSCNELLGSNHRIINSGTHPKEFFEDMWSTISQGEQWGGEICNRNKDGDLYWVYTVIFPVMFENEISAYYSLRVDITEQKKMEESLADEREKNVHASQLAAIGEISAGIGHEISNPLTVLSANIELLSRLEMPPEKKEKAFGQMAKSVNRINKIVKGLHHLAQGSRKDERSLHNLQDVFSNTLEFCEEAL